MVLKNKYLLNEREYVCDVCSEAITHPICPACLTLEVDAWLTLYPNLRRELIPKLNEYLKKIENKIVDSTICIKCKNKRAAVCTYCFTERVFEELKKIKVNRIILKEFLEFFNFDFNRDGYSNENEKFEDIWIKNER